MAASLTGPSPPEGLQPHIPGHATANLLRALHRSPPTPLIWEVRGLHPPLTGTR